MNMQIKLSLLVTVTAVILVSQATVAQLSSNNSSMPLTPEGYPDIQGTYTFRTITPLQRRSEFGEKEVLTEEEAEIWEEKENTFQNRDLVDPKVGGAGYPPGVISYNEFWYERGKEVVKDRRTSLIFDPPNGRRPAFTERALAKRLERREVSRLSIGVEARSVQERCIMGFNSGPPMTPSTYNNNVQLIQTKDHFIIVNEMVHNARIVRMHTDEHREFPRKWEGDSIGHWQGNTLVVETDFFLRATAFNGSSENMHLEERFTWVDENTLNYVFTVEDPTTWTQPWSASFPMRRIELPIYEYACHEGNYGLSGVLAGWRRLEQIAEQEARAVNE